MRCPFCQEPENKVIDSRESHEGSVIRRRRECLQCHRRFTTYERVEELNPLIVKKDGRREAFDREKMLVGLKKAGEKEVLSTFLGEEVMKHLRRLDEVAYVRFASVYRSFRDIAEFMSELKELINEQGKGKDRKLQSSGKG